MSDNEFDDAAVPIRALPCFSEQWDPETSEDESEHGNPITLPVTGEPNSPTPDHGGMLPSASDFDSLGDDSFLRVERKVPAEPGWYLTPAQQTAEDDRRAAANAQKGSLAPCSLPSYRYGRGLNMLQLGIELSARAVKRSHVAPATRDAEGVDGSRPQRRRAAGREGELLRQGHESVAGRDKAGDGKEQGNRSGAGLRIGRLGADVDL